MSRGSGLCGLCGGVKRGRSARTAAPIADCLDCRKPICERHSVPVPDEGAYRCTKCARALKTSGRG